MEKKADRRVGLLGGTFNPIHLGHLRAAEEIRETLTLDRVYFIPALTPPHKTPSDIASPADRLKMIECAIRGNPHFEISDVELRRKGPSYTVDTLTYFSSNFPDSEFYFIVGSDLFSEIDTWKDYKRLFELSNFAVITRPGFCEDPYSTFALELRNDFRYYKKEKDVVTYLHKGSKLLVFVRIEGIQVSSTQIRRLLREGRSIKYLVPDEVESYILSKKLYKKEEPDRV